MILVTVGTGHYPFARLLDEVARIADAGVLDDRLLVQHGVTPFSSTACEHHAFLPFEQMKAAINEARVVVTHGGSTSFLTLAAGKVPIIVPRRQRLGEVVDDHQHRFALNVREVAPVLVVEDVADLEATLVNYDALAKAVQSRIQHDTAGSEQAVAALHEVMDGWFPDT